MSTSPITTLDHALTEGTWSVDEAQSALHFAARGMFGLAKVNGRFQRFAGELASESGAIHGELRVEAASLDTGNARRDTHLRSADFFAVEEHPTLRFTLESVTDAAAGPELRGELLIRESRLPIVTPLGVERLTDDEFRLDASFSVDRERAGVGWNKLGMVRGDAALNGRIVIARVGSRGR